MRTAFCLYGLIGGKRDKAYFEDSSEVLRIGHDFYKRNILDNNNCDVYVHSWSVKHMEEIEELYKPRCSIFQNQISFKEKTREQNHHCRWYSTKRSIELAIDGGNYDMIMVTRFDLAWKKAFKFEELDPNKFYIGRWCSMVYGGRNVYKGGRGMYTKLPEKEKKKCKHVHMGWPHDKNGIVDFWFIGNPEHMKILAGIYDRLDSLGDKYRDSTGRISSHHILSNYLPKKIGQENIERKFHLIDDFPLIRRDIFGCRK